MKKSIKKKKNEIRKSRIFPEAFAENKNIPQKPRAT
jgi:hypothetical protein